MVQNNEINLNNDVFFKYILSKDDSDSEYLRRLIITDFLHINYKEIQVINPEINPQHLNEKTIILDILLKDDIGRQIDIEMQVSTLSGFQRKRFQYYACHLLSEQLPQGYEYNLLKEVYQIIFITDDRNKDRLYDIYTSKNEEGEEEDNNLIHRIYVYIPYIDKMVEEKGVKNLTAFEKLVYMFQNNLNDDILEMKEKVVSVMEKKRKLFTEEESLHAYAMSRQLGKWQYEMEKREMEETREEFKKTKKEFNQTKKEFNQTKKEFNQTKKEFNQTKKEFDQTKKEFNQTKKEFAFTKKELDKTKKELNLVKEQVDAAEFNKQYQTVLTFFKKAYPNESTTIFDHCTLEQLEKVLEMIFEKKDIQDIKDYLK